MVFRSPRSPENEFRMAVVHPPRRSIKGTIIQSPFRLSVDSSDGQRALAARVARRRATDAPICTSGGGLRCTEEIFFR